jgi:hypothetical protein
MSDPWEKHQGLPLCKSDRDRQAHQHIGLDVKRLKKRPWQMLESDSCRLESVFIQQTERLKGWGAAISEGGAAFWKLGPNSQDSCL